jgi:hypothetical protein
VKKLSAAETERFLTRKRQEAAQLDAERSRARKRRYSQREGERRERQSIRSIAAKPHQPFVRITPPSNFSLLTNTDAMLDMFAHMTAAAKSGRSLFLEMADVESITPDAIAVLDVFVGRMARDYGVSIGGSEPSSSQMTAILRRSGFYSHVRPPSQAKFIAPDAGIIAHEEKRIVDPQLAQQLVHFATTRLIGHPTDNHAIYAALGEMMGNTFDHAHRRAEGYEHWWASVYYDETTRTAHFTFFDTGVGIFGSREVSSFPDRARALIGSDTAFLRHIFEGRIASRTGQPWRGQGLPRIYQRVERRQLTNMTVITNSVRGHLDTGDFRALSRPFPGTLYHWELTYDAKSNN